MSDPVIQKELFLTRRKEVFMLGEFYRRQNKKFFSIYEKMTVGKMIILVFVFVIIGIAWLYQGFEKRDSDIIKIYTDSLDTVIRMKEKGRFYWYSYEASGEVLTKYTSKEFFNIIDPGDRIVKSRNTETAVLIKKDTIIRFVFCSKPKE